MSYMSETAKVQDQPQWMKYITGRVADVGAGAAKIVPDAYCLDGRELGQNQVRHDLFLNEEDAMFDTIFSSHFLEHTPTPYEYIMNWWQHLNPGGVLFLYMPDKHHYDSKQNLEHCFDWTWEDFRFFFVRNFCGEGKNYKGEHFPKMFELIDTNLDIGHDRYSFYLIAKRV